MRASTPAPTRVEGAPRRGLLTPTDVAALLGVPPDRVRKMRAAGTGPSYIAFGRTIRYHPRDVESWLRKHKHEHD